MDVVAALPAGSNAIGKLAANSGVDIGDVDITSIVPLTGATNLGKAIQTAQGATDTGVGALAVRNDVLADLAGADGRWTPLQVNADGALYTEHVPNNIGSGNSTTSTLAGDAVFTGSGVDVLDYATITIQIDASHDSAAGGMDFQFSIDNSNWDAVHPFTYTAADGARVFQFAAHAQYFRVVYTNGDTEQTHFRLQTILHHTEVSTSIHRLGNDTDPDRSATLHKSAIIAQAAGSGDFVPVQSTGAGNLKMAVEEFDASLPAGDNNIGNVDIVTVLTGSGALNLGKIEDGPHSGGDLGVMALAIRDDALAANAGVGADLDYVPLRTNNDGALWAQLSAGNLGGCKMFNDIDLDEADIDVATGPCTVYAAYVLNTTAGILHLKLFNTNTVTMGTTVATASLPIPANADSDGAGFVLPIPACGVAFDTALTVAVTTAAALDDNGAPAAGAAMATIFFQD